MFIHIGIPKFEIDATKFALEMQRVNRTKISGVKVDAKIIIIATELKSLVDSAKVPNVLTLFILIP
jgi:hypothetical protein